ncbi:MAG: phosphoesterase PA-phosphatase related protein, partial [Gemmatimonadetes bacterium]|nr:phosphoesterase PA-phosphatase related protein [Gemmatimonadota bacterium]
GVGVTDDGEGPPRLDSGGDGRVGWHTGNLTGGPGDCARFVHSTPFHACDLDRALRRAARRPLTTRLPRALAATLLLCAAPASASAQSVPAPTAPAPSATLLTSHDLGVLGFSTLGTVALSSLDARLARVFADSGLHARHPGIRRISKRASVFTETVYMIAGGLIYGIDHAAGGGTTEAVAFHATEAVIGGAVSIQVVRGLLGRARPFVGDTLRQRSRDDQYDFHIAKGFTSYDYRSFPSMHAMASFAVASALAQEMRYRDAPGRRVVTPLLYGFAALPAVSRLYLDEHWASDIALGVVIGVVAGQRAVGFSQAHPDNRMDRRFLRAGIMRTDAGMSFFLAPSLR